MDSQRAREILLLYRLDSVEAQEPEVQEALECVKRDPELRHWFEEHCARQSGIRSEFKQIPVPEKLREQILGEVARRKVVVGWKSPIFQAWAAAAAVVLLAGAIYFWPREPAPDSFSAYRNRMIRGVQRMYQMPMVTNNLAAIRQYLTQNQGHADYVLPPPVQRLPGIGCAILQWRSRKVSLICLDAGQQRDLYLFVIDRADLLDPPPVDQPQFSEKIGRLMSASWSHGDKTYILAGQGDEAMIRSYL